VVSDICETRVREFDRRMQRQQRNVLLFVDNCPAHPKITGLKAIKLELTPPNTTSVLQPMDQGIIRCFKFHYRKLVLQCTIDSIDQWGKKPEEATNVLQALRWIHRACHLVKETTIANYFQHAFKNEQTRSAEECNEIQLRSSPCFKRCTRKEQ